MVRRYLLTFTLLIVLPVLLLLLVFSRLLENVLVRNLSTQSLAATQQIAQGLEEEAKRIALLTSALANNEDLLDSLSEYASAATPAQTLPASRQVSAHLDTLFNYTNQTGGVFFFFKNSDVLYHRNTLISLFQSSRQEQWYRHVLDNPRKTNILQTFSLHPEHSGLFWSCAFSPGRIENDGHGLEMLVLSFKSRFSNDLLQTDSQEDTGSLLVVNAEDNVIFDGSGMLEFYRALPSISLVEGAQTLSTESGKYLVNVSRMPYTGMRVIKIFDYAVLTSSIRTYSCYVRTAFAVVILLFAVYTIIFFQGVVGPLRHVVHNMMQVGQGDMTVRVSTGGMAEIRALNETFNRMVAKIGELTSQIEQKERQRAQSEIDALQFQINPHFLSNTLNAIKMMATLVRAENIQKMTAALMTILSATFRDSHAAAPLEEQLGNLESYVYIMKVRFGDSFDVLFDIPEHVRQMRVLKMLLQPVLENSILHGIRELEHKGRIEVRAWQEDSFLYLEVSDNGVGMSDDMLEAIWNKAEHPHKGLNCIGIRNVHERIRLNYGDAYGLRIQSAVAQGTRVTYTLPVIMEPEYV